MDRGLVTIGTGATWPTKPWGALWGGVEWGRTPSLGCLLKYLRFHSWKYLYVRGGELCNLPFDLNNGRMYDYCVCLYTGNFNLPFMEREIDHEFDCWVDAFPQRAKCMEFWQDAQKATECAAPVLRDYWFIVMTRASKNIFLFGQIITLIYF